MRRALRNIPSFVMTAAFLAGSSYTRRALAGRNARDRKPLYYVDPINPAYKPSRPGTAPDCGMQLEAVYAGIEVTGWRFGDEVEIVKGLDAGERVVMAGTFLLDSETRMNKPVAAAERNRATDPTCEERGFVERPQS